MVNCINSCTQLLTSLNNAVEHAFYVENAFYFVPTHTDQNDKEMTVKIGFCDVASFT